MAARQPTVLFLCADNSVRSQLAEALLRHRSGGRFEVHSAGLTPKAVHPLVAETLREIGVADAGTIAKPLTPFLGSRSVRYAIILRAADEPQAPRIFPFAARLLRWEIGDPLAGSVSEEDSRQRLRHTRDAIDERVCAWVAEIDAAAPRSSTL
jgi:arsenate reductase (thioredoxin)